jgi:hypothetical protein
MENDVLDEIHGLLGADFIQGLRRDPHSKFIDHNEQVAQAPGRLLDASQEVQTSHIKRLGNGDHLEFLGQGVNLSSEVLSSSIGFYNLCYVAGHSWPVKTLSESLPDHAS